MLHTSLTLISDEHAGDDAVSRQRCGKGGTVQGKFVQGKTATIPRLGLFHPRACARGGHPPRTP